MLPITNFDEYLAGRKLYGDDFSGDDLQRWWQSEEEGYSGIVMNGAGANYSYNYDALHRAIFFTSRFSARSGLSVLGMGSAFGDELLQIRQQIAEAVIVDPSDVMAKAHVLSDVPVTYVKAQPDCRLALPSGSFDLVTCFGVLHHIAKVSLSLEECFRVLKPGGTMFCREPIVSQGDWRVERPGLTRYERGIPYRMFIDLAEKAGFHVVEARLCDFSPLQRLGAKLGRPIFSSRFLTALDLFLSRLFSFNLRYHRPRLIEKFGPASVALILERPR